LASELGITHREIERMRLREVQRQFRYWGRYPTVRDMVAGYLGVKPPESKGAAPQTETDMARVILMHGAVANG
jgi:hypothetical protein